MGLIVQLPVLPTEAMSLPGANPEATAATTGLDGAFAALLSGHTGTALPDGPSVDPAAAPPPLLHASDDADDAAASAVAALIASVFATPAPAIQPPPKAEGAQTAAEGAGVVAGPATMPAWDTAALGDSNTVEAAPVVDAGPGEVIAAAAPPGDAAAEASAVPAPETPGASPTQVDGGAPRGESAAPPNQGAVRIDGDAPSKQPGGRGEPDEGRGGEGDRPLPRASATGIAHAAPHSAAGELRTLQAGTAATSEAPPAARASPSTAVPPQVDQVVTAVIERVDAGGGEARIHLDPADLGEVVIHVRTEGDSVHIEVDAERPEAMQLLKDHTRDLSQLLGSKGMNLAGLDVALGQQHRENAFSGTPGGQVNRPASGAFAAILGLDDAASLGRHNRIRAAYNPDGALLYRV